MGGRICYGLQGVPENPKMALPRRSPRKVFAESVSNCRIRDKRYGFSTFHSVPVIGHMKRILGPGWEDGDTGLPKAKEMVDPTVGILLELAPHL
jgi:hypothetical protein